MKVTGGIRLKKQQYVVFYRICHFSKSYDPSSINCYL